MVQKGKLADCAFAFDKQLKRVDLPTFGSPTIPHCNAIIYYFIRINTTPKPKYQLINNQLTRTNELTKRGAKIGKVVH